MANDFYVTTATREQVRNILSMVGEDQAITVDFSPWAEDNATVTSVTWTTETGDAVVDGSSLSSNVESVRITTANEGTSLLKAVATDGTHTKPVFFKVTCKDPETQFTVTTDYNFTR